MSPAINKIRDSLSGRVRETRIVLIIFFSVGVFGIAAEATRDLFISLTPLALMLSLATIIAFHQPVHLRKETALFIIIYFAGFLLEAAGVNTGRVFGNYSYGQGLGIKVFNTPLMIGINWVLLVYCTAVVTDKLLLPVVFKILIASSLMVLYDLIMEQVAPIMDMWSFDDGSVPFRNYAAWFIIAVFFHAILKLAGFKIRNRQAHFILYIQASFFIILLIFFKLAK